MKKLVFLVLVSLILAGCANNQTNNKQWELVEQALVQNRLQLEQLRTDLVISQETASRNYLQKLESLENTVSSIQDEQLKQLKATQQELAELKEAAQMPSAELNQAKQDILELTRALEQQSTGTNQKVAALEREIRELKNVMAEDKGTAAKAVEVVSSAPSTPPPVPAADDMDPVRRIYENARAEYVNGQFQRAITKFTKFVEEHPESEFCGNAYYWKGESYYAMSEWKQALKEFQTVATDYPNSWKEIDAQLKIGMCYINLREHTKARAALNIIRRNFPQYERMDLVNHYLNQID